MVFGAVSVGTLMCSSFLVSGFWFLVPGFGFLVGCAFCYCFTNRPRNQKQKTRNVLSSDSFDDFFLGRGHDSVGRESEFLLQFLEWSGCAKGLHADAAIGVALPAEGGGLVHRD